MYTRKQNMFTSRVTSTSIVVDLQMIASKSASALLEKKDPRKKRRRDEELLY